MKFREGDRVVLTDESGKWVGTVIAISPYSYFGFSYTVKWDTGGTEHVYEEELQHEKDSR